MWLVIIGAVVLIYVLWSNKKYTEQMGPRCENNVDRKHHWVLRFNNDDRKGYLCCKVCGKIPGEDV